MSRATRGRRRRLVPLVLGGVVLAANTPITVSFVAAQVHRFLINRLSYKRLYGHWQTLELPSAFRVHAIHAALLSSGRVLLMAGSGNDDQVFATGVFKTLLWGPSDNSLRFVPTPSDVFCGGHAFLANGDLLVAGGTQRYEILANAVTRAGGGVGVLNGTRAAVTLPAGTVLRAPDGEGYRTNAAITVPPSRVYRARIAGVPTRIVQDGFERVWVDALRRGAAGRQPRQVRYHLPGRDSRIVAVGDAMTLDRQFFQGSDLTYVFDHLAGRYDAVRAMRHKRWYPSLVGLSSGNVLAVSGLDGTGDVSDGHTEVFDVATGRWHAGPVRYFPTYPALFLLPGGRLFFSGASTGYGPATYGRTPGVWDLGSNAFIPVGGLRDAGETETAGSVLLPPAQDSRVMILGGGGIGNSTEATARTAIADLRSADPRFVPGPSLPRPTRYPLSVVLPDDTVFVTGGARYYRGDHQSDNHDAEIYTPATNRFAPAASPEVGRNYHSEALLLPDGRVATFGSNPLWGDLADTVRAPFEERIELYSPPYLFRGPRPRLLRVPATVRRGSSMTVTVAGQVGHLRLIHPGADTHVTDLAQRSVALGFSHRGGALVARMPADPALVPSGWYMLFAVSRAGVPSVARWVQVT